MVRALELNNLGKQSPPQQYAIVCRTCESSETSSQKIPLFQFDYNVNETSCLKISIN